MVGFSLTLKVSMQLINVLKKGSNYLNNKQLVPQPVILFLAVIIKTERLSQ